MKKKGNKEIITSDYVFTNTDERYQFEHLVIRYRTRFNVWQVFNLNLPSYEQLLFEVVGYSNQADAFLWAKDHIKENKYNKERKINEKPDKNR